MLHPLQVSYNIINKNKELNSGCTHLLIALIITNLWMKLISFFL